MIADRLRLAALSTQVTPRTNFLLGALSRDESFCEYAYDGRKSGTSNRSSTRKCSRKTTWRTRIDTSIATSGKSVVKVWALGVWSLDRTEV